MNRARRLAALPCGRRSKWVVLVLWIILLVALGPLAGKLTGAENNQASSWLPGSAESTKVLNLEGQFASTQDIPGVIVYTRAGGLTPADHAKAAADAAAFAKVQDVSGPVAGPITAKDGKALETIVPIDVNGGSWTVLTTVVDHLRTLATSGDPGLTAHITGPAGNGADQGKAFSGIDGTLLYATLGVVVVLLLLTYRSPTLWLLPLLSSGLALVSAEGLIYLLAKHAGLTVNAQSAGILLVLVIGAGTDYALLLVARYREELRRHADRHEAMAEAVHRAGPAILASAGTVALSMLCLLFSQMNSTSGLGPVCAIGVLVALAAMLTLLPALLTITGRWVFWPVKPAFGTAEPTESGAWARVGGGIARRPRLVWIGTSLALGALALGMFSLKADGLTSAGTFTDKPDSVVGQTVLDQHFPGGAGSPIVVIAAADAATRAQQTLAATPGITSTTPPVVRNGLAYLTGTFGSDPDSQAAKDTVDRVRAAEHALPGARAEVGGNTAVVLDTQRASRHDDFLIIPIVLVVVLLILALLLRAVVAPLVLIATVVLSFASALGLSSLVFTHLFHFEAEDSAFPLFVFVFLVALGIDYNIFLMTRVREESATRGTRGGALAGLAATGGVITSAGLILASTFGVLGTLPVVGFAEIGFAVCVGVLLDTLVVRSILVTALTMDLDRRLWWPSALSKVAAPAVAAGGPAAAAPESQPTH
ncbi:MMPL family transporter [Streptacidiphilus sp. PB12-B1b]|uniref:MMPL family transporter n=1 Tax=Streptacidiphilus sp. PB12-B1b TaxID=2705012 RepID=UPI0015F82485|nr:MMPL family transporter [Streptacidiphilus sp. PB12-B1b]QMU74438.1 MMPL family transporter [Streptacidiphilus sp. PB12-B1b]